MYSSFWQSNNIWGCSISQTGANDVYHVRFADGKTRYLPAIPQVVVVEVGERFSDNLAGRLDTLLAWSNPAEEEKKA